MDDDEILKTVESMLGTNVKIVDCEKISSVREEEVLLINGIPITLDGDDGVAIKKALLTGEVPSCDLLNQLLFRAGIMRNPVHLETTLSVKTTLVTKEDVTVARDGRILDERSTETKEDNFYTSECSEVWEPVKMIPYAAATSEQSVPKHVPIIVNDMNQQKTPTTTRTNSICTSDSSRSSASSSSLSTSSSPPSSRLPSTASISEALSANLKLYDNSSNTLLCNKQSNAHELQQLLSPCIAKKSLDQSLSCDSGHDDLFSCIEQTNLLHTPNSMSSCYDFSSDETDYIKTHSTAPSKVHQNIIPSAPTQNCKSNYVRTKPQHSLVFGTEPEKCPKNTQNKKVLNTTTQSDVQTNSLDVECDDDNELVYRDGTLISGSLDTLIRHMVPTAYYYPDKSYLFAFLLSARLFIRPHDLLERICSICNQQQFLEENSKENLDKFANNFVQFLAEWIETFPYDFRDERLMHHVRAMTQKCIDIDSNLRKSVSTMLQQLLNRLTVLDQHEEYLARLNEISESGGGGIDNSTSGSSMQSTTGTTVSSGSPAATTSSTTSSMASSTCGGGGGSTSTSSVFSSTIGNFFHGIDDITELCPSPTLLAHQLTHIELERLSHIGPEEFVQAFANENAYAESVNDMKKTRNLESYVQWFNRLSYLVATEIVKHRKKKQRARIVEFWIETARESFNIGNFNSLMAIIAGLNMSPISRLKKTWAKVQSAKFLVLEHQMDPSSNFNSYRSTLKAAMWRSAGATDERQRIIIPFFSLLVKDLYFLNEGCSNKLPNGHINFDKFWQLAKQVTEFIAWKQVNCTFDKLPKVIMFLQTNQVLNENTLAWVSFECEPPDNIHEKDRYKTLKAERHVVNSFLKTIYS